MRVPRLLVCAFLQTLTLALADKTVFLQRPGNQAIFLAQPAFSPQVITADIGEQVHFVALFEDQRQFHPQA